VTEQRLSGAFPNPESPEQDWFHPFCFPAGTNPPYFERFKNPKRTEQVLFVHLKTPFAPIFRRFAAPSTAAD